MNLSELSSHSDNCSLNAFSILIPPEFREIARLSDECNSAQLENLQPDATLGLSKELLRSYTERNRARFVEPLRFALSALSDDSLKEIMGWVLLGRDLYGISKNPRKELQHCIRYVVVNPRNITIDYLIRQPLGQYLRNAQEVLNSRRGSENMPT
jgi:hypothetical protein